MMSSLAHSVKRWYILSRRRGVPYPLAHLARTAPHDNEIRICDVRDFLRWCYKVMKTPQIRYERIEESLYREYAMPVADDEHLLLR